MLGLHSHIHDCIYNCREQCACSVRTVLGAFIYCVHRLDCVACVSGMIIVSGKWRKFFIESPPSPLSPPLLSQPLWDAVEVASSEPRPGCGHGNVLQRVITTVSLYIYHNKETHPALQTSYTLLMYNGYLCYFPLNGEYTGPICGCGHGNVLQRVI